MIQLKAKPSQGKPRSVAVGITVVLMLGMHAGLKGLTVPAFASGRDVIRQLDPLIFERFAPPPPPEEISSSSSEAISEEVPEETAVGLTLDQEVGLAMEQLERLFSSDAAAPSAEERSSDEGDAARLGIAEDLGADRFESLFGAGDQVVIGRTARGRTAPASGQTVVGIGITERLANPDEARLADSVDVDGPAVSVETAAVRTDAGEAAEVVIREFEADGFGESETDLLATWMRANRAQLPVGVRAHLNFDPSFLTAVVPFVSDGRELELFLMFNESLRELHIVLVEGEESVYLIDRGFQEQSRSLREGTVRRANGEIVAVDSRSGAASSARAREFYNIFLSWWEVAKQNVGTQ